MGRKSLISIAILLITTLKVSSQSGPSTFEFVENKGQWDKRVVYKGELPAGEFYLLKNGFTVVQHNTNDLMRLYNRHHNEGGAPQQHPTKTGNVGPETPYPDDPAAPAFMIHSHAYRVEFVDANENPQITPDKVVPSFNNYFIGNDPSKWASNVKIFGAVVYKNIYPNIDVRYYSESGRLKYDMIINPGGDVNNIIMKYAGADKLSIKNNELIVKTSVGDVKELYPYAYQFDKTTGRQEVKCYFELVDKDKVKFKISNYSKTSTLVIDPILIFSSFTGSKAGNWGYTATPGPDGSLYSGSIVFDAGNGFPASPGAYQSSSKGGRIDIGILKFNPTGTQRSYATYLGGGGNEHPHSIVCDNQGNLVIMGRTNSTDYPGTRKGKGGADDIIVTKLNANGSNIIGSLIIGGTGPDGINIEDQFEGGSGAKSGLRFYGDDSRSEVILDNAGNIYVAAQTQSVSANPDDRFYTTPGVFQPNPGATSGSIQDGVVMKITPNCDNVTWSSFLGGSADDGAFVLAINQATNDLFVAGFTNSSNFPGIAGGVYQNSFQGGPTDGFVSIISNDGTILRRSTYAGTPSFDAIYGIQFDNNAIPYIMGVSEGNWPVQNARYSNPNSRQFICKLKTDLSGFQYSTVFGSGSSRPNISPVAFLVDRCENVYISGWGGNKSGTDYQTAGTAGMPITRDALKSITDNEDFYFIVIKKDADTLLYGTFFGQDGGYEEHVDGGTSRYDKQGVIYQAICANCFGGSQVPITKPFPITPGVWGPVNGTGTANCNLAAVKIAFNFAGVASGPKSFINGVARSYGCVPLTVMLRDTVRNAKRYEWSFGDGSPDVSTTNFEVPHTYNAIGDYRVRLIAIDSTTCNMRDTAYLNIRVRDDQANLAMKKRKAGVDCYDLTYEFTNLSIAPPTKPFKPGSFTWDFGDGTRVTPATSPILHKFAAAGTYIVRLILTDTAYCNAPDSIPDTLRVSPLVDARFEVPNGCAPYDAVFNNTSLAGEQFFWDFGDGATSTADNPTHTYSNVGTYTVRLIAIDTNTCNKIDTVEHTLTVNPLPTAEFSVVPVPPQVNKPAVFTNLSTGGTRYEWYFGDGDSEIKMTMDATSHQYNATGTYNACLLTYNEFGCLDSVCHPVEALIDPLLDVPNAFTPGRFGKNSTIRVEGFGIAKMIWRIYNRWGQVVFEAHNIKSGWDGTYKGLPQPMDVYAYTLDVEFTDGRKQRKSGDITLIR